MRPWMGCLRRCSDAAAALYQFGFVVAERRSTAAAAGVERLQAPEAEVFVSQASLGEMAIKASIGWLQVDLPELECQVPLQGFRWLPICNAHLLAVADLETDGVHRDPFDRLLVCQIRVEPMLLLTLDREMDS